MNDASIPTDADYASLIAVATRTTLRVEDDNYVFEVNNSRVQKEIRLAKNRLSRAREVLERVQSNEDTIIATENMYETLVSEESSFPRIRSRLRNDGYEIKDDENGVCYRLNRPSDEFLLYLLSKASQALTLNNLNLYGPVFSINSEGERDIPDDIFDYFRRMLRIYFTLRVESRKNRSLVEMAKLSNAFIFQVSYNTDIAMVPQRHLEELFRTARIGRVRRAHLTSIDPPRRYYEADLIYHYQLAVGTDNPFLEYISYYHIAEHFFEAIFNEDLVARIRDRITMPDFSYKRNKDISVLIKTVTDSLKVRNETITFSEQEALRLTLEKHCNIDILRGNLHDYDPSLSSYYKETKVPFSNGDTFDLENDDIENIRRRMAARIYKTRNAIVHSKESERSKYMPFRDDRLLVKEVPLLRFIAEQIILSTSSLMT
jgi:hypothetical protein